MSIVYTGGTFDLLHAGHADFLRVCKLVAGEHGSMVVGLNEDEFVKRYKGTWPICPYAERRDVLLACRYVDAVVANTGGADSKPAIDRVKPDFIVIGDDWAKRDYYKQMDFTPAWLQDRRITLLYVARHRVLSSTEIKARVSGG